MTNTREQILGEVLTLLNRVVGDWEYPGRYCLPAAGSSIPE